MVVDLGLTNLARGPIRVWVSFECRRGCLWIRTPGIKVLLLRLMLLVVLLSFAFHDSFAARVNRPFSHMRSR